MTRRTSRHAPDPASAEAAQAQPQPSSAPKRRANASPPTQSTATGLAPATRPRGRPRKQADVPSYHHGTLPEALLTAAETVLRRDGLAGLGLRAIAREAGVSHTAPKHHFGDTRGLLSQLAAVGFVRLKDAMECAMQPLQGQDASARRLAIGAAYVRFAQAHPALFGLMFRNEMADMRHPALADAQRAAMRVMASTISGKALPEGNDSLRLSPTAAVQVTAAWAMVHGLANLLIDERLGGIVRASDHFADPQALCEATLQALRGVEPGLTPTSAATPAPAPAPAPAPVPPTRAKPPSAAQHIQPLTKRIAKRTPSQRD